MIKPFVTETQESGDPLVLGYWNIRGMAQQIRFLLVHLDVKFIEHLYNEAEQEEWEQQKNSLGLEKPSLPYLIDERPGSDETVSLVGIIEILKYIAARYDPSLLGET